MRRTPMIRGMEIGHKSGKSQGILKWKMSGNPVKALVKRLHLKMLSAYFVCCIYLLTLLTYVSIDANSADRDQTVPIGVSVYHRGFKNISADDKNRRLLLRIKLHFIHIHARTSAR